MTYKPYMHIAAAGLLFLFALGAYLFWFSHVSKKSAEAAQLSVELQALGDAGGRASSVRRALENITRDEAAVYGHLVGSDTIVSFLEKVEATGADFGARVEVVSVANAPPKEGESQQLQMSLSITGSFDAVMRTLGTLEYQAYGTTLTGLTLDTPPAADAGWTAAAEFLVGAPPALTAGTQENP